MIYLGSDKEAGGRLAPKTAYPSSLAQSALRRQAPEVGAVCGKAARTDLCGGRGVTRVPTATSRRCISCMSEVIGAFLRAERSHKRANPAAETRNGPFSSFPEMGLEFAERLLDRIKVRRIFGKIT